MIATPTSFYGAALAQRVCAVCGRVEGRPDFRGRTWHAHHVVPRQVLARERPEWEWHPWNALRLCTDCHWAFEHGGVVWRPIDVTDLCDENVCFIWQFYGLDRVVALSRRYSQIEAGLRWQVHRMGECERCQLEPMSPTTE